MHSSTQLGFRAQEVKVPFVLSPPQTLALKACWEPKETSGDETKLMSRFLLPPPLPFRGASVVAPIQSNGGAIRTAGQGGGSHGLGSETSRLRGGGERHVLYAAFVMGGGVLKKAEVSPSVCVYRLLSRGLLSSALGG